MREVPIKGHLSLVSSLLSEQPSQLFRSIVGSEDWMLCEQNHTVLQMS